MEEKRHTNNNSLQTFYTDEFEKLILKFANRLLLFFGIFFACLKGVTSEGFCYFNVTNSA